MDVTDFENILTKISDIISPKEKLGGTNAVQADERLALTLRFLATGETFQSLSFQYKISLNAVSYIVKGYCKTIVERMVLNFIPGYSSLMSFSFLVYQSQTIYSNRKLRISFFLTLVSG